ncbi:NADH-quinone oxidoreductase subunit L [Oceanibaculum pacificum]|uniref:NADH:ubiquinone oxidoreductase subunit L n=1 Tax=Oceanibaculum pacificum TaxID=580166 RepID=A0A154W8K9_9PROT|nr:NADH-quinone oxidoreductase subunit L [Oceanibaculum pacificum]KZD09857.1 NADH:ubiquinone oxidoreductase subunit L [Oceanibaculum pacificum]
MFAGIVFLPLLGAIVAGFFGRIIGDRAAQIVTCALMLVSMLLSILAFVDVALGGNPRTVELFTWIQSGALDVSWALKVDTLTAVMLIVVTVVSSMVHVYSVGYMSHDPAIPRFMAYLSLFTFFMLMLVTADNLIQMFFGWEGVGLASYLLIGFWFQKPTANAAAIKAFLVNRVGDFGFMLGIFGCFLLFDTVNFDQLFQAAPEAVGQKINFLGMQLDALTTVCLLLFVGAMGKSAQFLLHTWLPDAMEGPTPVSALIHAATMVTAGVFMVARLSPMFEYAPQALMVVTFFGAITAIFAATVGMVQNDIKRVIAYSTCSQLGYMFFAIGVSAYSAAIFHLMTHAFFKALLFLGAGSVIHAMSDEQDIRKMGGIWKLIPLTYGLMWIGSLALAGVPFFAGFYSKDIILESAFASGSQIGHFAFWLGILAAFLTAFYSWRLLILTFHGKPRADHHVMEHVHESPKVMTIPLIVLALGAIFAGFVGYEAFVGDGRAEFWGASILVLEGKDVIEAAHHVPLWVKLLPIVVGAAGIATAYFVYMLRPGTADAIAEQWRPVYLFLLNKWYIDELYDFLFVRPVRWLGRFLWKEGDGRVIDGFGPDGVAFTTRLISQRTALLQSGYLYHYAFAMMVGVVVLVTWYVFSRMA